MKYKLKHRVVTALQLSYDTAEQVQTLIGERGDVRAYEEHDLAMLLDTPAGLVVGKPGDFFVENSNGAIEVMSEHKFINMFEEDSAGIDLEALAKGAVELEKQLAEALKREEQLKKTSSDLIKQVADLKKAQQA